MSKNWIQGAVKHPGALTATAASHGGVKKGGGIKGSFISAAVAGKYGETAKKRAVLARTFKSFH